MAQHQASVTVNAPVHQVYELFSHFNDYPKFMSYVKEVTYYDTERSHWVVDVLGRHEWDAVNIGWRPDQQIGWRSTDGLENSGVVTFTPLGDTQTRVDVTVIYNPPAGAVGDVGEALGAGKSFERALTRDLMNFARMVQEAPRGALDPESSNYLFNEDSAAARGKTTRAQEATMGTGAGQNSMGETAAAQEGAKGAPRSGRSSTEKVASGTSTDAVNKDLADNERRPREDWPNTTSPADKP